MITVYSQDGSPRKMHEIDAKSALKTGKYFIIKPIVSKEKTSPIIMEIIEDDIPKETSTKKKSLKIKG